MTDITELAQRMKSAAVRAKTATEEYASGHMSVSVCYAECEEFNRLTDGPDNIIALVEALEKAQQLATQQGNIACALFDEVTAQRQRIAELEPRTVKLPAERFCPAEYAGSQLWSETEVWNKAITACADALRAAGIKVEAE
ncbi:hypothetical protein AE19_01775 [Klebsiella pneumoniae UCI 60]|uniref:hypothetical protein n=1 Tax=Klebsiella pneumoniae TaxID=573 RepID=UPI00044B6957|nr:hypothetical protein [Klebsiella pneumoniae]EZR10474.1 hypothetical protein AE19_01775 [Klebsiella pneumoniae UCI 60]MCH0729240.1 hypothetical protein [Klebsiella pneumoniae]